MRPQEKLKGFNIWEEDDGLYLELVYERKDEHRLSRITFPKIKLPISKDRIPSYENEHPCVGRFGTAAHINVYTGLWELIPVEYYDGVSGETYEDISLVERTLEEYATKLTVPEIEEKLGYKIEIVSEKEEF